MAIKQTDVSAVPKITPALSPASHPGSQADGDGQYPHGPTYPGIPDSSLQSRVVLVLKWLIYDTVNT